MCVIFKASDVRPTAKMVELAFAKNNHGAGVAWRSEVDGKPVVRWEKGLDIEAIRGRVETLPLPFVCHFRLPSKDTPGKLGHMCHPFPLNSGVSLELKGTTEGYVLFHNGHWNNWRLDLKTAA